MTQKYIRASAKTFYIACDPINALQCSQWVSDIGQPLPTWWKIELLDTVILTGYTFTGSEYSVNRSPKDFTFSGSNDGTSWTVLDTRVGISWTISETKSFTFSNTIAYRFYQFDITAANDSTFTTMWFVEFIPPVIVSASAKSLVAAIPNALKALKIGMFTTTPSYVFQWVSNNADLPTWYKIRLGTALAVTSYTFTGSEFRSQRSPKDFTLSGSNDDLSWTVLDTRTGVSWAISERKTFSFSNTTKYLYYRIDITSTIDGAYITITNLLFEPSFPMISDGNVPLVRRPWPLRARQKVAIQRGTR